MTEACEPNKCTCNGSVGAPYAAEGLDCPVNGEEMCVYTMCGQPDSVTGRYDDKPDTNFDRQSAGDGISDYGWAGNKNRYIGDNLLNIYNFPAILTTPNWPNDFLDIRHQDDTRIACHARVLDANIPAGYVYEILVDEDTVLEEYQDYNYYGDDDYEECSHNVLDVDGFEMCEFEGTEGGTHYANHGKMLPSSRKLYLKHDPAITDIFNNYIDIMTFILTPHIHNSRTNFQFKLTINIIPEADIVRTPDEYFAVISDKTSSGLP